MSWVKHRLAATVAKERGGARRIGRPRGLAAAFFAKDD